MISFFSDASMFFCKQYLEKYQWFQKINERKLPQGGYQYVYVGLVNTNSSFSYCCWIWILDLDLKLFKILNRCRVFDEVKILYLLSFFYTYVFIEAVPRRGKADKKQPEHRQPSSHVRNVVKGLPLVRIRTFDYRPIRLQKIHWHHSS